MRQDRAYGFEGSGRRADTLLLGRFGQELAAVYHDTLQAPLPRALQLIVDRLEEGLANLETGGFDGPPVPTAGSR